MKQIIDQLRKTIDEHNFVQTDRLGRTTASLPGMHIVIPNGIVEELKRETPLPKFIDDWKRMAPGFDEVVKMAEDELDSRRLLFFNSAGYYDIYQCFVLFHFVYTHRGEFDLYVYQRSSDLAKLEDDCVFYSSVMKRFEDQIGKPVTKLVVIFGHVHYEITSQHLEEGE